MPPPTRLARCFSYSNIGRVMVALNIECPKCAKCFKSGTSLRMHVIARHEYVNPDDLRPVFYDENARPVPLPKALEPPMMPDYQMWLACIVERINHTLHPKLPGETRTVEVIIHQSFHVGSISLALISVPSAHGHKYLQNLPQIRSLFNDGIVL